MLCTAYTFNRAGKWVCNCCVCLQHQVKDHNEYFYCWPGCQWHTSGNVCITLLDVYRITWKYHGRLLFFNVHSLYKLWCLCWLCLDFATDGHRNWAFLFLEMAFNSSQNASVGLLHHIVIDVALRHSYGCSAALASKNRALEKSLHSGLICFLLFLPVCDNCVVLLLYFQSYTVSSTKKTVELLGFSALRDHTGCSH